MRLKKLKLSGFKSFVDPTVVSIPSNLIGVVGPNGCGKSNIIDAVRWVMGESSAKHLRGTTMEDVIFSGSTARKPVGKAFVELVFDNNEGRAPGAYAAYSEISIRREVSRDGQSDYFLNKTRCRRKDITDLFLGTGLGPHAYSIIEQGMISRIIEARPEDLRVFIEEAAGISKYKERRRETENRIRHTRENLARVEDIRKELETQLARLQRQSKAAARYKELKQQERLARAQLLTLRWQALGVRIGEEDAALSRLGVDLEGRFAVQRGIETEIERLRQGRTEATDRFNAVQAEFYGVGAEIAGVEQAIEHARETREQRQRERQQIAETLAEIERHLESDTRRIGDLDGSLTASGPQHAQSTQANAAAAAELARAEQAMHDWQAAWEEFGREAMQPSQEREVQSARMRQLSDHIAQLNERQQRLLEEAGKLEAILGQSELQQLRTQAAEWDTRCAQQEQGIEQTETQRRDAAARIETLAAELEGQRGTQQGVDARLATLEELQAAALGKHDAQLRAWLDRRGLDKTPRLTNRLKVESGWEQALDRVLGTSLGAICVPDLKDLAGEVDGLKQSDLYLFELGRKPGAAAASRQPTLLSKVRAEDVDLSDQLAGIYVADDLTQAMAMRQGLQAHESIVTRAGILVGRNWLSLANKEGARSGMLARERDIAALKKESAELQARIDERRATLERTREQLQQFETARDDGRRELSAFTQERAAAHTRLGRKEAELGQIEARHRQLAVELDELRAQLARDEAELAASGERLSAAQQQVTSVEERRERLQQDKEHLRAALELARQTAGQAREALHRVELERQGVQAALDSTRQAIARLEAQRAGLQSRQSELVAALGDDSQPENAQRERLEALLQKKLVAEDNLAAARQAVGDVESALRAQEQGRATVEREAQALREQLEQARVARQELVVRRETLQEQVRETGFEADALGAALAPEIDEAGVGAQIEDLVKKIERIGPVNLIAIEEYAEQSERKGYLDKQYADLTEALTMLEDVMRKIDRETRTRFKDTFDTINTHFQAFFPRLFGGGHAYLELTGDDLLDTGVTVMARPPGKRNSTIHLLSGGEKALTAVSLLFAIFELNPAPFCLLDEVDAPLDDANVERYCNALRAMSQRSQLIFITHNKISMETADVLVGVTMSEPGVSRLVSVDLEQAVEMAAR